MKLTGMNIGWDYGHNSCSAKKYYYSMECNRGRGDDGSTWEISKNGVVIASGICKDYSDAQDMCAYVYELFVRISYGFVEVETKIGGV